MFRFGHNNNLSLDVDTANWNMTFYNEKLTKVEI